MFEWIEPIPRLEGRWAFKFLARVRPEARKWSPPIWVTITLSAIVLACALFVWFSATVPCRLTSTEDFYCGAGGWDTFLLMIIVGLALWPLAVASTALTLVSARRRMLAVACLVALAVPVALAVGVAVTIESSSY